ncbi:MAG: GNAT family N-acetyltransferase [Phycisphaeraceae bacterium]|nr:GNAT family N-acetyltransferase [Phycisphaeraceae bacterium]
MDIQIQKIDHQVDAEKRRLLEFLGPEEAHALFIVGNLLGGYPGQHIYVARRGARWLAAAGYYDMPRSLCIWGREDEALRALSRQVAREHPVIEYVNGIGYAAWPAYDELRKNGYEAASDPQQVFMEREMLEGEELPRQAHEDGARLIRTEDAEGAALVMRALHTEAAGPITEEECRKVMRPHRMVLEVDGRIVSTASSNGMGLRGFQILGVATLPGERRKGYARAVCMAQMRRMQGMGAKYCVLFTNETNTVAQGCYEGLGFRATGDFCVGKLRRAER